MTLNNYVSIRLYITNDKLEKFLKKNAQFQGISEFTDHVFKPTSKKSMNTDKNLMWCREIHKNVWPNVTVGKFYPYYKKNISFKNGLQVLKLALGNPNIECNTLSEAKKYFKKDLEVWFSFSRKTKSYNYQDISIYVENVQYIGLSVDIVCRRKTGSLRENTKLARDFMKQHEVKKVISHQVATLVGKALKKIK